jgi:type II secretory pathway pseudopilin PulG
MKGLEAMPLRFIASMAIIAMVVSVGFYELNTYVHFREQKDFKESMVNFYQAIRTMQSLGDQGSFTSVQIKIPNNYFLQIDNSTNRLIGTLDTGEIYALNLTADIQNLYFPTGCTPSGCLLGAADYEIRLVYGEPENPKNFTVVFV